VDADGLTFLTDSVVAEEITKDSEYKGTRILIQHRDSSQGHQCDLQDSRTAIFGATFSTSPSSPARIKRRTLDTAPKLPPRYGR
jgi:hypothetical protein